MSLIKKSADKLPAISSIMTMTTAHPVRVPKLNGITCIYRYADVLLMYAEASTRATNSVNAQALDAIPESTETCRLCTRPADHNY